MSYKTLRGIGTAKVVIKKSVFIGYASPANSEEEAKAFIAKIKAHHRDANSQCFRLSDKRW